MSTAAMLAIDQQQYEKRKIALQFLVDTLMVKDKQTDLEAKKTQQDIRLEIKMRKSVLDPFVLMAKKNLDDAKDERAKWIDPLEAMDAQVAAKVKEYETEERRLAKIEEDRKNAELRAEAARKAEEERLERNRLADIERKERERQAEITRKAREKELEAQRAAGELTKRELETAKKLEAEIAEREKKEAAEAQAREKERAAKDAVAAAANVQEVKVEANIASVAGVPSRRNYRARVIDPSRVPSKWWIIDTQALSAEARSQKKVGEIIPGVIFEEF